MKADVEISRVHKGSPYNLQHILFDIEGKDEEDILHHSEVSKALTETFGRKLKVSIQPKTLEGYNEPYWQDHYLTKEKNKFNLTHTVNNYMGKIK